MVKNGDFVALFHSMHRVLRAEKVLKQARAHFLLIPAPRELGTACGLAIRFDSSEKAGIEALLRREDLSPVELFVKTPEGFQPANDA